MPRVPEFTRAVVRRRAVGSQTDLSQIESAAAPFKSAGAALDVAGSVAQRIKNTQDMTSVNEAIIRKKREDIEFGFEQKDAWKDNPLGFAKEMEKLQTERDKQYMDSLPSEEAKAAFRQNAAQQNLQAFQANLNWENKRTTEMFANRAEQSLEDMRVMAYRGVPLDELKKDMQATAVSLGDVYSQDELVKWQANAERQITKDWLEGAIDTNPYEAQKLLNSREFDEALEADDIQSLTDSANREVSRLEKIAQEERDRMANFAAVENALFTGAPLDPKDKETKKALNDYYDTLDINQGLVSNNEESANQLTVIAGKVNAIPDSAVSILRGQMLNGTTEQKQFAVDTIAKIEESSPAALDSFPDEDISKASLSSKLIRTGVRPQEAFKIADENVNPLNRDVLSKRNMQLNAMKVDYATEVEDNFDPGVFTIGADLPDAPYARDSIVADYRFMFDNYYRSIGDEEVAKERANRDFKRFYGESRVTGGRKIMKYPPENFYSIVGLDNDWMTHSLKKDVEAQVGKEVDLDDIELLADTVTAGEAQTRQSSPTYQILIKDNLGQYQELRDENDKLLRYKFDAGGLTGDLEGKQQETKESMRRRRGRRIRAEEGTTEAEREQEDIMRSRLQF